MVGRDEAVWEVSSLLQATRFVSIVGAGGMGKTTVAVAAAHELAAAFGEAVHFVDLGMVHDASLVGTAMASAVGCSAQAQDPIEAVLSFVGHERMLLVLDNCEHLVDAAAAAAERLTKGAPQVHVLTTSREALRTEGENVYLLSPLEGPQETASLTAVEALTSPAIQLFMERAAAGGHRAPLSDADAPTVAQICCRLDGIPLAIELAAGRVGMFGLRATADLLDDRFRLLWHGRRTALPRHQTLHALLDWSFNLLAEPEQEMLCRLSVFVGNFTLDGAVSVAASANAGLPDVAALIESLVPKSLVWVSHSNGAACYRLPDTTRVYAAEKLARRGEADETSARHAEYCARRIGLPEQRPRAFAVPDAPHIDDIRVALAWCFSETGDAGLGVDLALQSVPLLLHLSLLGECERWAERAMSALPDSDRGTERELILLEALAISSMFTRGNCDEIRAAIERGLALAEALGALSVLSSDRHRILLPTFSRALAEALAGVGELKEALETVRRAASAAVAMGGTFELSDLLRAEGQILLSAPQPDVAAAEEALTRSMACARQQSALGWELRAAIPLARLWVQQGRPHEARAMLDEVLRQFREGFDTADLIVAETLRDELAGSPSP